MNCPNLGKKMAVTQKPTKHHSVMPFWVDMIQDLVFGAGFSYSRIAYRIKVSPSTVQKLATDWQRKPRHYVFHALLRLHFKVFHSESAKPWARAYWQGKQKKCINLVLRD
jgi:hypothetical protein